MVVNNHYSQDWAVHLMPSCRPHGAMGLEASGGEPGFCLKRWGPGKSSEFPRGVSIKMAKKLFKLDESRGKLLKVMGNQKTNGRKSPYLFGYCVPMMN